MHKDITTNVLMYFVVLQSGEPETLYKQIELRCKGHDDAVLDSYHTFVVMAANELGIHVDSV